MTNNIQNIHHKPGREAYTILCKPFFYALCKTAELLEEEKRKSEEFDYVLYGGTAMQLYFAKKLCDGVIKSDCINELRKYLRETSDFDFAAYERKKLKEVFEKLDGLEEIVGKAGGEAIYSIKVEKNGESRKKLIVEGFGNNWEEKISVIVTFYTENAKEIIKNSKPISISFDPLNLYINVASMENILKGKFMRFSALRDIDDIKKALKLFKHEINLEEIRNYLIEQRKQYPFLNTLIKNMRDFETLENYLNSFPTSF